MLAVWFVWEAEDKEIKDHMQQGVSDRSHKNLSQRCPVCALIAAWRSEQVLESLSLVITGTGGAMRPRIGDDKVNVVLLQKLIQSMATQGHSASAAAWRAGQGAWVWKEQLELESSTAPSPQPSLLAWLRWSWAAPHVWPVHILGAEVFTSISPPDALGLLGGAACAGAVLGEAAPAPLSFLATG